MRAASAVTLFLVSSACASPRGSPRARSQVQRLQRPSVNDGAQARPSNPPIERSTANAGTSAPAPPHEFVKGVMIPECAELMRRACGCSNPTVRDLLCETMRYREAVLIVGLQSSAALAQGCERVTTSLGQQGC